MANISDGTYSIELPYGASAITDMGGERFLSLLPRGTLGDKASQITIKYDKSNGGYSFKFEGSGKFITYVDEPRMNNKLVIGDRARYFGIAQHDYEKDKFKITVAEATELALGPALERIYPPWVAMLSFPEKQAWTFNKTVKAKL